MKVERSEGGTVITITAEPGDSGSCAAMALLQQSMHRLDQAESQYRTYMAIRDHGGSRQLMAKAYDNYELLKGEADRLDVLAKAIMRREGAREMRLSPTGGTAIARATQLRSTKGNYAEGYASVFYTGAEGTEYQLAPGFMERIDRSAFNSALERGDDVVCLFNHDSNLVLGRTTASPKTLQLSVDSIGLKYGVVFPNTTIGKDVRESIARGDVRGSSFAFQVIKQRITRGNPDVREILDVHLIDVSPVTYPAYKGSSVSL